MKFISQLAFGMLIMACFVGIAFSGTALSPGKEDVPQKQ